MGQERARRQRQRSFDFKWLIPVLLFVVALGFAIILNSEKVDESADKIAGAIAVDNSDLKINWDRYQKLDIDLSESLNITESGTYHLTGSLEDGLITVDAGVSEVKLVLDNVSISNSTGPAIVCRNAENLVIELEGENHLRDGFEYASDYDEDVTGVIYSKADLAFTGEGVLKITGNKADAIVGKDDVVVRGGDYLIMAMDDGIRGKDSVYITGGEFVIDVDGDALKSTNDIDHGKGFVMVEGGAVSVIASGRGIESVNSILIHDGSLKLETRDDAIHSDGYVGVTGGNIVIDSGDDGMHADRELIIDDGTINITRSYEGLEAQVVTINGGKISATTSDDGINAGGGADNSAVNRPAGQPGADLFKADEDCVLSINGGEVYINAAGDGVDSNGYLLFNGGNTVVDGPTNNGNGALDSGLGITIQGGNVIAVGSSGMAETLGNNSEICNISVFFDSIKPAGTEIEIRNSDGEVVMKHTAAKSFSHLAAGSESLILSGTYTVFLDGNEYESFTILEVTTTLGTNGMQPGMAPPEKK